MALWKAKKRESDTINYDWFRKKKAYIYCCDIVSGKIKSNVYVKKQCFQILEMVDNPDSRFYKEYFLSKSVITRIESIIKLMNFATGEFAGKPCYDYIAGFQWLILFILYGTFRRDDPRKRRFEKACIFISRKNARVLAL